MAGRGFFYKQKYGGKGKGKGAERDRSHEKEQLCNSFAHHVELPTPNQIRQGSISQLSHTLLRLDGAGYGAYRELEASWDFGRFVLTIDRAQADPFAPPSRMHVVLNPSVSGFPAEAFCTRERAVSLADFLARSFAEAARKHGADQRTEGHGYGGAKGGELRIDAPTQHVVERTSISISKSGTVEARFCCALPARGRTIEGRWCSQILLETLPALVERALVFAALDGAAIMRHILSVEDQQFLRQQLSVLGLVAFVANGAILPRTSGSSDKPMAAASTVEFISPPSLVSTVDLPNRGPITGMGIRRGVNLIVGGGFHGKSTLLQALQVGIYDHVPGDGREFVVVDPSAVKVRAEDGRAVGAVDISPFIGALPFGQSTSPFSTKDASGSTSQAAAIMEAVEVPRPFIQTASSLII